MGFNTNNGFTVDSFDVIINNYYQTHIDEWGQDVSFDQFKASKEYELYYTAAQIDLYNQGYFAQTFEYIKTYIDQKNQKIQRPTPIVDRIVARFAESDYGFLCSVRQVTEATRGTLAICLDYTPDAETNARIGKTLIDECAIGGIWTDGTITESVSISNGQSFDIKWTIPTQRTVNLKYTIIRSKNTLIAQQPANVIREMILENFAKRYAMGLDIEPQKYLTMCDLGWASSIEGERQTDSDEGFTQNVYNSPYNELFKVIVNPDDIVVV